MTKAQAIRFFGTEAELARRLNIKAQSIQDWKTVPAARQLQLHRITRGKLAADPDVLAAFAVRAA